MTQSALRYDANLSKRWLSSHCAWCPPYTGYESGTWVLPLAQSLPYQATAPRTLAGETNGRRIVDRISQLDDREISRAGLDTAIAHEIGGCH